MSLPEWPPNPRPPRAGADLADAIAQSVDLSWEESGQVLGVIMLCLRNAISNGQTVSLHGFGTLRVTQRARATVPQQIVVTFRAHKRLHAQLTSEPAFKAAS